MEFVGNGENYDILLKFMITGTSSVGKSLFMKRISFYNEYYNYKNLSKNHIETLGVDFTIFKVKLDNKVFKIQFWDSAGDEKWKNTISRYFRGCKAILIIYNSFIRNSFLKAKMIYQELSQTYKDVIYCLIRCKYDFSLKGNNNDFVYDEEALEFATKNNIIFCHISSFEKYETGIKELFTTILKKI